MPNQTLTPEEAALQLREALERTPEKEQPDIWDLLLFLAPAYGQETNVTPPWLREAE